MVFRLKCQIFQQQRHLANFFISFEIKPDVTSIGFTNKNRIFTPFCYQNFKNCKVILPIRIWIWMKYSWNLLMWNGYLDWSIHVNENYNNIHSQSKRICATLMQVLTVIKGSCRSQGSDLNHVCVILSRAFIMEKNYLWEDFFIYRTRATITRSWLETALEY